MDEFRYKDGLLHCEDLTADAIAEAVGTPCYVYSASTIRQHVDRLAAAFAPLNPLICFSIKSNGNLSICRLLAECGAGMDLVSGGELHRSLLAGVDPARCVYAGVGKTDVEIRRAIEAGVGWLNVESEQEFEVISEVAASLGRECRVALRVNPDVDPKTHTYTTTGIKETKFGVDIERAREFFRHYGNDTHARLEGIHLHLGSPIYSHEPYVQAIHKALALIDELQAWESPRCRIKMLDLGGGFGADYQSDQSPLAGDYARHIVPLLEARVRAGLQVILEPGRTIVANAGILLIRALYVKASGSRTFVICDGGMNVLMRPSHYGAFHFIWPSRVDAAHVPYRRAERLDFPGLRKVDVVGPVCESGDFLAKDRYLPPVEPGSLLAVFTTGAYGMTMASRYNSLPLPAEVMVDGSAAMLIRRRETYDDLTEHEVSPTPVVLPVHV